MIRLAFFGDRHVDARSPRYQHALDVWAEAVDAAVKLKAHHYIGCGDVCEDWMTIEQHAVGLIYERMTPRRYPARVIEVLGNHESDHAIRWLEHLGVTTSDTKATLTLLRDEDPGSNIAYLLTVPYPRRAKSPFVFDDQPKSIAESMDRSIEMIRQLIKDCLRYITKDGEIDAKLIVAGHWTVAGATVGDSDYEIHSAQEVVFPQDVFDGCALVVTGHIHKAQEFVTATGVPVVILGDLYRCSFAEVDDPKSWTLVTITDDGIQWERVQTIARTQLVVETDWPAQNLPPLDGAAEVKVVVTVRSDQLGTYSQDYIEDYYRGLGAEMVVVERKTVQVQRVRAPKLAAATNEVEEFFAWAEATDIVIEDTRKERLAGYIQEWAG